MKKTEHRKKLTVLSKRSDRHHKKILADIREKYRDTLRQMNEIYHSLENDLRPFMQNFYQRLREYQEVW